MAPRSDQAIDGFGQVSSGQTGIPLNHRQSPPPTEYLYGSQVYTGHNKPTGERVTVAVPCISVEPSRIQPSRHKGRLGPLHRLWEELICLSMAALEDGCIGIVHSLAIRCQVHEG